MCEKINTSTGNTLTGYASIDKPWRKYYRSTPIREFDENQTLYDFVFNANRENMDYPALGYYGNSWTFSELKTNVDRAADAFYRLGVKENDVVAVATISTPEVAIILLALNKLGAITTWLDIRSSEHSLAHYLNENGCKVLIAFDKLLPVVARALPQTEVHTVLTLSPADSLPLLKKIGYGLQSLKDRTKTELPKNVRFVPLKRLLAAGNASVAVPKAAYSDEKRSIIIQSSGTTGTPKSIVHTNRALCAFVQKIAYSDLPLEAGKTLLMVAPPWLAYGLVNSLFLALGLGMKTELDPDFLNETVYNNLGKFDYAFAVPLHYRYMVDNIDKIKKADLARIRCLVSGADKLTIAELEQMQRVLGTGIVNGWGSNEVLGAASASPFLHNRFGSIGIPKYGDAIAAFDEDTGRELRYGEVGILRVQTDTAFIEYVNDPTQTNMTRLIDDNGLCWVNTGDLGYVDEDGYIYYEGRSVNVIARAGFKIAAGTIEAVISQHPEIRDCAAVGVFDAVDLQVPMVFVALTDSASSEETVEAELRQQCKEKLKAYENPVYYRFVEAIPYTDNNKHDFKKLEKIGNEYVASLDLEPKLT